MDGVTILGNVSNTFSIALFVVSTVFYIIVIAISLPHAIRGRKWSTITYCVFLTLLMALNIAIAITHTFRPKYCVKITEPCDTAEFVRRYDVVSVDGNQAVVIERPFVTNE